MLEVQNLFFSYGEVAVLRDICLRIPQGKVVSVMGRNGVGKTTLMRNIAGLEKLKSGSISLAGQDLTSVPPYHRVRAGIGYVPQGRQIFPRLTVEENLRIGLPMRADKARVVPDEIYELFPICKEMRSRMGGDLSGGQQQQLAIGRALVCQPKLLILDEPTEGIQPNIIHDIGEILKDLASKKGLTILLVEQYLKFVKEFSELFYVMNRGQVVAEGETRDLSEDIVKNFLSV